MRLRGSRPPDFPIAYAREPKTLGEHLRKARLYRGLRQRDLAEQLGVRVETVANWEKNRGRPLARHYPGIFTFLGFDPAPALDTLAARLRAARLRLGLTQEGMVAKLGLDEGSVCRWESGSRHPSLWMAGRVSALLDALERDLEVTSLAQALNFFDATRWRRKPPSDPLAVRPRTLGERLRSRRLALGLSQEETGRRFGVGRATFYWWERGGLPPAYLWTKLRRFLGAQAKSLIDLQG